MEVDRSILHRQQGEVQNVKCSVRRSPLTSNNIQQDRFIASTSWWTSCYYGVTRLDAV
jgi:hypothetical protein